MEKRTGIFAGDTPFEIFKSWLAEAEASEINDPNAICLATVDAEGMPNCRMVLLKNILEDGFVFYTNYRSKKADELEQAGMAAFTIHWKSLRRQIRVRGTISREDGVLADAYFATRALGSRIGAWASRQSSVLLGRDELEERAKKLEAELGETPPRPPFWGGYRLTPLEIEFWADGRFRLHDRFQWHRDDPQSAWEVVRLSP